MVTYRILTDDDIYKLLSMKEIVQKIEDAFREKANGALSAPPRFRVNSEHGALVFTAGAATGTEEVIGFRVYNTFPGEHSAQQQIVAVFDSKYGTLIGIAIGQAIGRLRTGAIGGTAIKYMARSDAFCLAMLGTGFQARSQLEAAIAIHRFQIVKVYSRNRQNCQTFADDMGQKLGIKIQPVDSAQTCMEDADVIICATNSATPVFDAKWVKAGAHINTIGPKSKNAHEVPIEIAARCTMIATDSLEQLQSYSNPHFLLDTLHLDQTVELCDIVTGKVSGRQSKEDITLFCSVGLAGTEVIVAAEAFKKADKQL